MVLGTGLARAGFCSFFYDNHVSYLKFCSVHLCAPYPNTIKFAPLHPPFIRENDVTFQHGIALENIDLTLGNGAARVHVLNDISLQIQSGESVGIVGPSGSGKSTLLMVLAGLEKVDSGKVLIRNERIDQMSEDQAAAFRGRNIGIVFQSFHLIPNMTALENVAVPLELAGRTDAFDIAEEALHSVGLGHRLTHYPSALSGGEQQRVAIARALAPKPAILIADEPTGNLDTQTGRQIADLLFAKQREYGLTMVLVTHDPALAARCEREILVGSGQIVSGKADTEVRVTEAAQ
jgi:putative ABC transport system ATP-binding protein